MMRLIKHIILTVMAGTCLIQLVFADPDPPPGIVYVSPVPGSDMLSASTNVIIRFDGTNGNPEDMMIRVTGSQSGSVTGSTLADNDRGLLIFQPSQAYSAGERVFIELQDRRSQEALYRFNFQITHYPNLEWKQKPAVNRHVRSTGRPGSGGILPDDFPEILVTIKENPPPGFYFLGASSKEDNKESFLTILDTTGMPVFYRKTANAAADFKLQANGLLTYMDYTLSYFLELDSSYRVTRSLAAGNGYFTDTHELLVLEDGSYWILALDVQMVDMSLIVPGGNPNAIVLGAIIQYISDEGVVLFQWRSFDHFQITDTDENFVDLTAAYIDYVHANALSLYYDGNILMSSRHLNEITNINTTNGDVIWRMGGNKNQFTFVNDPHGFGGQHSIFYNGDNSYTLFNNGNFLPLEQSNGMEYALDQSGLVATLTNEYNIEEALVYADAMGHMQRLADGHSIIGWAANAKKFVLSEFDTNGERIFEIKRADSGLISYRAFKFQWETNAFYFSADSIDYGSQVQIGDSATLGVVVHNNFGEPIEINGYHTIRPEFTLTTALPVTIPASGSQTFNLQFKPAAEPTVVDVLTLFFDRGDTCRIANQIKVSGGGIPVSIPSMPLQPIHCRIDPNPSSGISRVSIDPGQTIISLEIFDLSGKCLSRQGVNNSIGLIDAASFSKGLYFLQVRTGSGIHAAKWLVH